jgi:excinuclease ABC subunit C
MAPCTGQQTQEEYHRIVRQVRQFLEGHDRELVGDLRVQMDAAATREDFEEAARLRDRIFKIERTLERQRITQTASIDQDVIGIARHGTSVDLQVLFVRGGLLIGRKDFFWLESAEATDEELVRSAIEQFYNKEGQPPRELLIPVDIPDAGLLAHWLSDKRGEPVRVLAPERGTKHQLVLLAEENAAAALADHLRNEELDRQAGEELQRVLRLKTAPKRIEGFDISNTMGNQSVASMVVWEEGRMKKSDYRRFKIASVEGANDFASMHEVVTRRYGRMEDLVLPDLVLIDGGLGQLASARAALQEVGRPELAVIGLAKAKGEKDERVYLPGRKNPIVLRANSPATHLLQRVRDEAHRFAVTFHRTLRGKTLVTSQLDQIIGIGSITRTKLLKQFGSLANLAQASEEALREAGLSERVVRQLRRELA